MSMTYKKLYRRIRESTGLDVLTPGTMQAIIENAAADLDSRGYRDFQELTLVPYREQLTSTDPDTGIVTKLETDEEYEEASKYMFKDLGYGRYSWVVPEEDVRRILYLKIVTPNKVLNALRLSITDDRVNNHVIQLGAVGSSFTDIEEECLFYTNKTDLTTNTLYFEMRDRPVEVTQVRFGYDAKITTPDEPNVEDYDTTIINIRDEYNDALVLYGVYHVFNRYGKEIDRIQLALNNYKYYVEDITSTLAHEDDYDREQGTKILEHM